MNFFRHKFFLFGIGFSVLASAAHAYLPPTPSILKKCARNAGRGAYLVELEVQLHSEPEALTAQETWRVQNGEELLLTVRFRGQSGIGLASSKPLAILYRGGKRYSLEAGGNLKVEAVKQDQFEPIFHFRSADGLGRFLVAAKLLPSQGLSQRRVSSLKTWQYEHDPYVSLSRIGAFVAFALGSSREQVNLWIDQNDYFLRKLKLSANAELTAENFEPYAKGLNFPKDRTLNWGDQSVTLTTTSIKLAGENKTKVLPAPQVLLSAEKLSGSLPTASVVREFYSRFR